MAVMNGYTVTPHHRQNRRRERPGSRTRRTITRKAKLQHELSEGFIDAYDSSVYLPTDRAKPSPLLRENFHQNWQRWKEREAEEQALAEMDKMQLEIEQQRLYGGEISDDELYRMGILYNNTCPTEDIVQDININTNVIAYEAPLNRPSPLYALRVRKPKRQSQSRQRSTWRSLPLNLSLSTVKDEIDIAQPPSTISPAPTIQHRQTKPRPLSLDIPQSLPPPSAFSELSLSPAENLYTQSPISSTLHDNNGWELVNASATPTLSQSTTPSSDPETWIILSDDS